VAQSPAAQSPESQTLPQPPQLFASMAMLVHALEHAVRPVGHVHMPPFETAAHVSPLAGHVPHANPPAPQDVLVCEA
jgi:hypothetical protein